MALIDSLPAAGNTWVVPFVTWGMACSGVALWQMSKALAGKGYRIAGAVKVGAVHSMMWQANPPAGGGHPDEDDLQQVRDFADKLLSRIDAGTLSPLPLEALDYQPESRAAEFKAKLDQPWIIIPKTVRQNTYHQVLAYQLFDSVVFLSDKQRGRMSGATPGYLPKLQIYAGNEESEV